MRVGSGTDRPCCENAQLCCHRAVRGHVHPALELAEYAELIALSRVVLGSRDKVGKSLIFPQFIALHSCDCCGMGKLTALVARGRRRRGMLDRWHLAQLCP